MKYIATVLLVLFVWSPAMACSFKQRTTEELFASSSNVFRARITEVKLATLTNPARSTEQVEVVEAKYEIKEVFKGTPSPSGLVRDLPFGPGNCSLGLLPGMEYVFFPSEHEMVLLPTGSFAFFAAGGSEVAPRLEALRKLAIQGRK